MIEFELTEDHKALVQTVREFAQKEVAPYIKEWDEKQEFQPAVLKKMAELNLLGVCIPEEYGGAGFDYISLGLVCEELEAVDTFMRVVMSVHTGLNSLTLYTWGTEEQKQKYLVPQAKGEKIATYGLTEPGAGSDVVGARSTARREGDEYVLNGEKMWISLADVADNFLFFCWTDEEKRRKRDHTGMSCFIVERSMKGFSSGTIHGKLGIRAGNTGYFSLQDVRVPKENLVGEEGEGFKIAMFALEQGRYTVAAGATGVIRASRDASVAYANTRETFGTKIANHQLVKQKIAEMEADYQMSHLRGAPVHDCVHDRAGRADAVGGGVRREPRRRPRPADPRLEQQCRLRRHPAGAGPVRRPRAQPVRRHRRADRRAGRRRAGLLRPVAGGHPGGAR